MNGMHEHDLNALLSLLKTFISKYRHYRGSLSTLEQFVLDDALMSEARIEYLLKQRKQQP